MEQIDIDVNLMLTIAGGVMLGVIALFILFVIVANEPRVIIFLAIAGAVLGWVFWTGNWHY